MPTNLKTLLAAGLAILVAGTFAIPDIAEAKRFGGGGSMGKQYKTMPRQAQPPQQANRPTQQTGTAAAGQRAPAASGASRWLGPLAGLAAGGLLASLFFGDAFEGFQIMDFLIIAALIAGAFFLFRMLRRGAHPQPAAAGAGAAGFGGASPGPADLGRSGAAYRRETADDGAAVPGAVPGSAPGDLPETGAPRGGHSVPPTVGAQPSYSAGEDRFPHWFDGISFIEGAKTHFIRLQAAWDKSDLRDIREYTTPQLFAELSRERERLGGEQYTEVVQLRAELVSMQRDDDRVVASIRFHGLIREEETAVAEPFDEVWHVQHDWDRPDGDWLIAGIQQS
jgi:predicted lipid-binding transport protein (Tim44 family)